MCWCALKNEVFSKNSRYSFNKLQFSGQVVCKYLKKKLCSPIFVNHKPWIFFFLSVTVLISKKLQVCKRDIRKHVIFKCFYSQIYYSTIRLSEMACIEFSLFDTADGRLSYLNIETENMPKRYPSQD